MRLQSNSQCGAVGVGDLQLCLDNCFNVSLSTLRGHWLEVAIGRGRDLHYMYYDDFHDHNLEHLDHSFRNRF